MVEYGSETTLGTRVKIPKKPPAATVANDTKKSPPDTTVSEDLNDEIPF